MQGRLEQAAQKISEAIYAQASAPDGAGDGDGD
jgi:hypothetical protein